VKSRYSILLVVAIAILLVGFVGLGISHNQEPPTVPFTPPPPQVQYTPHFDSSPYGMGYSDGYYGNAYSTRSDDCDYYYWEKTFGDHRDFSGNLLLTYEEYCRQIQDDNERYTVEYTQGYIDGSIDRKMEE